MLFELPGRGQRHLLGPRRAAGPGPRPRRSASPDGSCCPPIGRAGIRRARSTATASDVHGLGPPALADGDHSRRGLVGHGGRDDVVAVTVPTAALELRPVEGIDPDARPRRGARPRLDDRRPGRRPSPGWTAASPGPPGPRPRAGRRVAPCSSWPASTRSSASSSAGPSARSRPSATGWPRRWWPSRWPRPARRRLARRLAGHGGHGQGGGRARGPHRGPPLPAGAGRHRLHHRAPFHRYVRRVLVLDGLFGTSTTLTSALGDELIASRSCPRCSRSDRALP